VNSWLALAPHVLIKEHRLAGRSHTGTRPKTRGTAVWFAGCDCKLMGLPSSGQPIYKILGPLRRAFCFSEQVSGRSGVLGV
jgi:hypothetical protein